jgi:hypothetical protein
VGARVCNYGVEVRSSDAVTLKLQRVLEAEDVPGRVASITSLETCQPNKYHKTALFERSHVYKVSARIASQIYDLRLHALGLL